MIAPAAERLPPGLGPTSRKRGRAQLKHQRLGSSPGKLVALAPVPTRDRNEVIRTPRDRIARRGSLRDVRDQAPSQGPVGWDGGIQMVAQYRDTMDAAPVSGFMKDPEGRYIYANPAMLATFATTMGSDWLGKTDADLWPPQAAAMLRAQDDVARRERRLQVFTRDVPLPDGQHKVLVMTFPIPTSPTDVYLAGMGIDLTESANNASEHEHLYAAVQQASESIMIADPSGAIAYVNPAFERITGYSRAEVVGQNPRLLKSGLQPRSLYESMWAALKSGAPWAGDLVNRRKDGSFFTEEAVISPILDSSGEVTGFVQVNRDVTRERLLAARSVQAVRERTLIAETIGALRAGDKPEVTAQAICRQVVHLTGIAAAQLLLFELDGRATPIGYVVEGRPDPPLQRLRYQRSRRLIGRAAEGPWIEPWMNRQRYWDDHLVDGVGFSSPAFAPVRYDDVLVGLLVAEAIDAADKAAITEALPALVEFADLAGALIGPALAERADVGRGRAHISGIIDRGAFQPVFQPIVDLALDAIVGYEALTRFTDGSDPEKVFAEAAAVDLGAQLEAATLKAALAAAKTLPPSAWLNLNASPEFIMAKEPLRSLLRGIRRNVVLEVTEHTPIADYSAFRAAMAALGPNIELAVDDAGVGFASLRHILELRPAFVKLDRWLVTGLETDNARQAMIVGLRHFARSSGCRLIAEGIETDREFAALRSLDIQLGQGYLLGRPGIGYATSAPN
jgi:PAS domain S-box-containing protein